MNVIFATFLTLLLKKNENIRHENIHRENCSIQLPIAKKKIRELFFSMTITKYKTVDEMVSKLQNLKAKIEMNCNQNLSNFHDEKK